MHSAKRFFYASLGILALAVAFHLGTRSAQGQAGGTIVAASASSSAGFVAVDAGGQFWLMTADTGGHNLGPLAPSRSGNVVAVGASIGSYGGGRPPDLGVASVHAIYSDGEVWAWYASSWRRLGNVLSGGPVPTTPTTWGRIKAERR